MGRKHAPAELPQRSRKAACREQRRNGPAPESGTLGISRNLERGSSLMITTALHQLRNEGELPESLSLVGQMKVDLLSARQVGNQVLKGLVAGYRLGQMSSRVQSLAEGNNLKDESAEIYDIRVNPDGQMFALLQSDTLEAERQSIAHVAAGFGVKGLHRGIRETKLRMTVGHVQGALNLSLRQEIETVALQTIDQINPLEIPMNFSPWVISPDPNLKAA